MFSKSELDKVLENHEKAYRLFRWINQRFREGQPPFEKLTEAVMHQEEAHWWMKKNLKSFPRELLIEPGDLEMLSYLFASFLNSSFEVAEAYAESSHGCGPDCGYCTHWIVGKHLKRRRITGKSQKEAKALKRIYVQQLSASTGAALPDKEAEHFIAQNKDLAQALSFAAYGHELIRRSKYQSQGAANLVLWKEINPNLKKAKWGRERKLVRLESKTFIDAEKRIVERFRAWRQDTMTSQPMNAKKGPR